MTTYNIFSLSTYRWASNLTNWYFDGSVQYGSNSIANALELLQSYTKPPIFPWHDMIKDSVYGILQQHVRDTTKSLFIWDMYGKMKMQNNKESMTRWYTWEMPGKLCGFTHD